MNWKKILLTAAPVLIITIAIIIIAVSCTIASKPEVNPSVPDSENAYITVKSPDGKLTYTITKQEVYEKLKSSYGTDAVINLIDAYLMKNNKNSKGESYYDAVTTEEIDKYVDDAIFKDLDKDSMTQERIDETIAKYEETIKLSGYEDLDDYKANYIRLVLAKKAYAKDAKIKEINEQDSNADSDDEKYYTDSEYTVEYNNTYKDGYWAIYVGFSTEKKAEEALKQLGIKMDTKTPEGSTTSYDTWVHISDNSELTPSEVANAFIALYNNQNTLYVDGYPTNRISLTENVQYTYATSGEDTITKFNTVLADDEDANKDEINKLYHTYSKLNGINAKLYTTLQNTLSAKYIPESYTEDEVEIAASSMVNAKWYTPETVNCSSTYYFILKLDSVAAPSLVDVHDDIFNKMVDAEITDEYVNSSLAELRKDNNLIIYDDEIESTYVYSFSDHETTKKKDGDIVAKIDNFSITTAELYKTMDERYGAMTTKELALQEMFLHSDLNTVYDVDNKEVLDKTKWREMAEKVVEAKRTFNQGYYVYYYTWEEYCRLSYGTSDIDELKVYFLYSDIVTNYSKALGLTEEDVKETSTTTVVLNDDKVAVWNKYLEEMKKTADDYFGLSYIQIVITAWNEDSSNNKDFSEWSDYQKMLAEKVVDECIEYLKSQTGTYAEKLSAIATAYDAAPYLVANGDVSFDSNGELVVSPEAMPVSDEIKYVLETIPLSAAKSAGLVLTYEAEASYTNTTEYVEDFLDAGKWIWDNVNHEDYVSTPYILEKFIVDGVQKDYLTTSYGYHLYVNTKITEPSKWSISDSESPWIGTEIVAKDDEGNWVTTTIEVDKEYILPSLKMIMTYIADSSDETINTSLATAITTYFTPMQTEVTGSGSSEIEVINWLNSLELTFGAASYTKDDFDKYITLRIKALNDTLTYFKED